MTDPITGPIHRRILNLAKPSEYRNIVGLRDGAAKVRQIGAIEDVISRVEARRHKVNEVTAQPDTRSRSR